MGLFVGVRVRHLEALCSKVSREGRLRHPSTQSGGLLAGLSLIGSVVTRYTLFKVPNVYQDTG
jgi:hypothetical protein